MRELTLSRFARWFSRIGFISLFALVFSSALNAMPPLHFTAKLKEGTPIKIVCFGDSITGIYYHTGGRRTWCDLLEAGLKEGYPQARLQVSNAGISGNDTGQALARIDRDVIDQHPDLVVAMFGMNDLASLSLDQYRKNLTAIVQKIQAAGAEVLLMSPNNVYSGDPKRSPDRLRDYVDALRRVSSELQVPLVDAYSRFVSLHATSEGEWAVLMSDTIHPNLSGHLVFAQGVIRELTQKEIVFNPWSDPPPFALDHVKLRIGAHQKVRVVASPLVRPLLSRAFKHVYPNTEFEIENGPTFESEPSGEALIAAAKQVGWQHYRESANAEKPDLVVLTLPPRPLAGSQVARRQTYSAILNGIQSFGPREWDCLLLLPSALNESVPEETASVENERLLTLEARGKDMPFIQRKNGEKLSPEDLIVKRLDTWLTSR